MMLTKELTPLEYLQRALDETRASLGEEPVFEKT